MAARIELLRKEKGKKKSSRGVRKIENSREIGDTRTQTGPPLSLSRHRKKSAFILSLSLFKFSGGYLAAPIHFFRANPPPPLNKKKNENKR